jgi:diphthamide biosynthesis enzyme Dph1/Dph2-like protein
MKSPNILYVPAILKKDIRLTEEHLKQLPKLLFVCYSIQYKKSAESIKQQLIDSNINVVGFQQVLGCSKLNNKQNSPILLIGSGLFHANNLFLQAPDIFIFDNGVLTKVMQQEIDKIKIMRKTAIIKYLSANNIGILVSTKPMQEHLKSALALKQQLTKKGKSAYIFIANNIDINQFENFNIDSWVNTACIGLAYDNPSIINIDELPKY